MLDSKPLHFCEPPVLLIEEFASGISLVDGGFDGEPFEPIDWVAEVIEVLFGVMMYDSTARHPGFYRLIQEVLLAITRGQMKSTFEEFMACVFLAMWPAGSEGCFAQQSREETLKKMQPKMQRMLENSPICEGLDWRWVGASRTSGGTDRFVRGKGAGDVSLRLVTPQSTKAAKGSRFCFGLMDEIGFMMSDRAEELIEEAIKKSCVVPDPIWILASTQSPDPAHYQRKKVARALEVQANPVLNPRLWPVLYVSDATVNVADRQVWLDLGPLFKRGLLPSSILEQEFAEAELDPRLMNIFARERVGFAGDYSMRFMPRDAWLACAAEGGRQEILERMRGRPVYAANDFSEMDDLSAFALIAYEPDGTMLVAVWHFIPASAVQRLDALTRGMVGAWIKGGWLEVLPEGEQMPERVAKRCLELIEPLRDDVVMWGYDKWHSEGAAIVWRDAGWQESVTPITQGAGLNAPIKAAPIAAVHGEIAHEGNPVLDFCVLSAFTEADHKDPDKLRLVKMERGEGPDRIDGAVAMLTAMQTCLAAEYYRSKTIEKGWGAAQSVVVA